MKISNIIVGALARADEKIEANPFNYLGLMRRMHNHVKKHPNSAIRNFPIEIEEQPKKQIQKISREELGEALKILEENKAPFRLDQDRGVLAMQNAMGKVEVLNFKLVA